jgi:hypothetical protein
MEAQAIDKKKEEKYDRQLRYGSAHATDGCCR